jgi:hypothetical protein
LSALAAQTREASMERQEGRNVLSESTERDVGLNVITEVAESGDDGLLEW